MVRIVRLFEGKQDEGVVVFFLLKAELAHHRQVRLARGEEYALGQYMQDLWTDKALEAALRAGFEDGVKRLDFRQAWIQEGYDFPADLPDE